jgi:hypothetical protein
MFAVLNIAYQHSVHLLPAYHKEAILSRSTSLSTIGCLVVAATAIPRLGATGACLAVTSYALMAVIPNALVLRGLIRITGSHGRMVMESMLVLVMSILLIALLATLMSRPVALLVTSLATAGLISLLGLYRSRSVLEEALFTGRRAARPPALEQAAT